MKLVLKSLSQNLPLPIARLGAKIPFSLRLGPAYRWTRELISWAENETDSVVGEWQLGRIVTICETLRGTVSDELNLHTINTRAWREFARVTPILTKEALRTVPLEMRSREQAGRYLTNTGGTSGTPLSFYLDRRAFAREWAHMHTIWARIGYSWRDKKLTLRGKNLGEVPIRYNPVHNEYVINTYIGWPVVAEALKSVLKNNTVGFIHGYPSLVSDFAAYIEHSDPELREHFRKARVGVLLGSEFPAPQYREQIRRVFGERIQAWYGHSEMAILAYETEANLYRVMPTYGVAEAVKDQNDGSYHLVTTSLWNDVSPFIRYDTGDTIEPVEMYDDGVRVKEFRIDSGRVGDYVVDKNGHNIALTALIFGRHHQVFDHASFVQVYQPEPGRIEIQITPADRNETLTEPEIGALMDMTGIDMDTTYRSRSEPFRSPSGKTPLLIKSREAQK